jgi:hypothetical protein
MVVALRLQPAAVGVWVDQVAFRLSAATTASAASLSPWDPRLATANIRPPSCNRVSQSRRVVQPSPKS